MGAPQTGPYIQIAGRTLTLPERLRWQKHLTRGKGWATAFAGLLILAFSIDAWRMAFAAESLFTRGSSVLVLLIADGWLLLSLAQALRRRHRRQQGLWYTDRADKKRDAAGTLTAFYGDRAEFTDIRGTTVLPYAAITHCRETADGFALLTANTLAVLRAEDMTAYDVDRIRTLLKERLAPSVFCRTADTVPHLAEPLPFPVFQNDDVVIARAQVPGEKREIARVRQRLRRTYATFLFPALLVFSVDLTLTLHPQRDFLLFLIVAALLFEGGGWLLARLLLALFHKPPQTVCRLAFTKEGLAVNENGVSAFAVCDRYRLKKTARAVIVRFVTGERVTVPLTSFEDPDALWRLHI